MAQRGLINTTSTPQHRLTGHQKRYHDHQATIEHLQQDIARIRHQQDVIVARFMQEVLPLEHQYLRAVYAKHPGYCHLPAKNHWVSVTKRPCSSGSIQSLMNSSTTRLMTAWI